MKRLLILKKALKRVLGSSECKNPNPIIDEDRNKRNIEDAIQHACFSYDREDLFRIKYEDILSIFSISDIKSVPIEDIGRYDDFSSWANEWEKSELAHLTDEEKKSEIKSFRSGRFSVDALDWIKNCEVPPIIIVEVYDFAEESLFSCIGDGRGRVNIAIGMGWESLPVIFLTENT